LQGQNRYCAAQSLINYSRSGPLLNHRKHILTLIALSLLTACSSPKNDKSNSGVEDNSSASSVGNNSSALHPNIEQISSCDENSAFAQKMLQLINDTRTRGYTCQRKDKVTGIVSSISMPAVSTVTWNAKLCQAAQFHTQDMAANNFHEHKGSKGDTLEVRLQNQGYQYNYGSENIARGYSTAAAVHQGWLTSDKGHCENVMSVDAEEVGVAMAKQIPGISESVDNFV
jgi:uncharacterized protein YkwD